MGADTKTEVYARLCTVREQIRKRLSETAPPIPEAVPVSVERLQDAAAAARSLAPAIGTINPRPEGLLNAAIQGVKEAAARLLDWQVARSGSSIGQQWIASPKPPSYWRRRIGISQSLPRRSNPSHAATRIWPGSSTAYRRNWKRKQNTRGGRSKE